MEHKLYPTSLTIKHDIGDKGLISTKNSNHILQGQDSIVISIRISSTEFPVKEIRKSIREIFEKVCQYYV